MFFIVLTFLAAFSIEGIGTYISVLGLAAIFASNPIIMVMAVVLDFAKLVTVSFVYKKWTTMNKVMRIYMMVASLVLMTITSAGAFGYLSAEFQQAVIPNKESAIKMQSLTEEQGRLQARKVDIDKQIADTPQTGRGAVANRIRLINSFKEETKRVNDRLVEIDAELPKLKIADANVSAHTGPIAYVATAFNTSMENAVKYVILLIIFVFDPLAISLILAGNFLVDERDRKKKELAAEKHEANLAYHEAQANRTPAEIWLDSTDPTKIQEDISWFPPSGAPGYVKPTGEHAWPEQEVKPELELVPMEVQATEEPESDEILPADVPAEVVEFYKDKPAQEPEPAIITRQQLDKMYKERLPYTEEIIPRELTVNEVFTPEEEDVIIDIPTKGIMSDAAKHFPGAEVTFGPSPSTIEKDYREGTVSQTPDVI